MNDTAAELKVARDLLEEKNRRLAELYDASQQFVDHVSYEFRTPLTVIKEFTSIIREGLAGETTPLQREYLDIIADRAEDLSLMVTDMLDTSRLEAGLLSLVRRPARVAEIVQSVFPALERRAESQRVRLQVELEAELPDVHCDREKTGRVIVNLVIHALKSSREGDRVRVWARPEAKAGHVIVGVSADHPRVQELTGSFFDSSDAAETLRCGARGLVLGLDVARQLVALNLGDLSIESEPDGGQTFQFTIPMADPEPLIGRYLKRCTGFNRQVEAVSLVLASPAEPMDAAMADGTDDFLHHLLRRSDLVLRGEGDTWLLLVGGHADDLDKVLARIDRAWSEAGRSRGCEGLPRLALAVKGTWPLEGHSDVVACSLEHLRAGAAQSP